MSRLWITLILALIALLGRNLKIFWRSDEVDNRGTRRVTTFVFQIGTSALSPAQSLPQATPANHNPVPVNSITNRIGGTGHTILIQNGKNETAGVMIAPNGPSPRVQVQGRKERNRRQTYRRGRQPDRRHGAAAGQLPSLTVNGARR